MSEPNNLNMYIENDYLIAVEKRLDCTHLHDKIKALYVKHFLNKSSIVKMTACFACVYYVIHTDPSCPPLSMSQFEVAVGGSLNSHEFRRRYNDLVKTEGYHTQVCAIRPTIYVKDVLNKLNAPEEAKTLAYDMCVYVIQNGLHAGKSPSVIAGSIAWLACNKLNLTITQRQIANCLFITMASLRSNAKDLDYLNHFPSITKVLPITNANSNARVGTYNNPRVWKDGHIID